MRSQNNHSVTFVAPAVAIFITLLMGLGLVAAFNEDLIPEGGILGLAQTEAVGADIAPLDTSADLSGAWTVAQQAYDEAVIRHIEHVRTIEFAAAVEAARQEAEQEALEEALRKRAAERAQLSQQPKGEPSAPVYSSSGGIPAILIAIRGCESGHDYTAQNPTSTASGAYQFLKSTWAGYGGYSEAYLAPPSVQDQAAIDLYNRAGTTPWNASRHCWG